MKIISFDEIVKLQIEEKCAFEWIKSSFKNKADTNLPPKISMHNGSNFINIMPCILYNEKIAGVKVVSRFADRTPTLNSEILVYDNSTGNLKALMDGNYITALRTGAVAALCVETLAVKHYSKIGVIGFGNITRKTLDILFAVMEKRPVIVNFYNYKNHFDLLKQRYSHFDHIELKAVNTYDDVVRESDVIISAITHAERDFCSDDCFKKGCLVVPIHTLGFQNCDLFFDKFVVDDIGHIQDFKYYDKFKKRITELTDILTRKMPGRANNDERIMAYCIGIAIHDMYFANKIFEALDNTTKEVSLNPPKEKYWV